MSVTSIGSNLYSQNLQSNLSDAFKQRKQDFTSLANALNSGNLQGAQQAFASLQQDMQTIRQGRESGHADQGGDHRGGGRSNVQGASSQRQQDFTALANALKSGNLQSAQQAFATLQQDMQAIRQDHRHHHGGNAQSGTQGLTAADGSASATGDNLSSLLNSINTNA